MKGSKLFGPSDCWLQHLTFHEVFLEIFGNFFFGLAINQEQLISSIHLDLGASMVKWTKKVFQYTNTVNFLVKGLKEATKCGSNWDLFFLVTSIVVLNTQM
jgi:hypothetical protein